MMEVLEKLYHKRPEVILIILGILVFIANLDVLFVNIMEARNFITAREMLVHGNWIFTTMNELPRYQKPPLPTWLTAVSAWLFGITNLFAYRLPAALASLFLILTFYKLQLLLGIKKFIAFTASIILMTSFYVFFAGREGQWDIYTHSFMVGACYFFILLLTTSKNLLRNSLLSGIFLGASLLSKGPVSLYALFLPFILGYAVSFKFEKLKSKWRYLLLFVVVGVASGSWWSLIVHYYDPEEFAHIAALESNRWFNYNVRPFWYYWSFFTQSGIWTIPAVAGLCFWYLKHRVSNLKAYKFFLFWTLFSLLLLSIIPEKKSRYLLPVLIPLSVTTAFYVQYAILNFKERFKQWERLPLYFNFALLSLICFAAPFALYYFQGSLLNEVQTLYYLFSLLLLLWGGAFVYGLYKKHIKLLFGLQAGLIILILTVGFPLLQVFDPSKSSPNVDDFRELVVRENLPVLEYNNTMPELVWKYGQTIPILENKKTIPVHKEFILLVEQSVHQNWCDNFPGHTITPLGVLDLNPQYSKGENSRLTREYFKLTWQEP